MTPASKVPGVFWYFEREKYVGVVLGTLSGSVDNVAEHGLYDVTKMIRQNAGDMTKER